MSEVTHNVQLEPQLHTLSGENLRYRSAIQDDDARVDIRASGFWRCLHRHIPFLMSGFSTALQPLIVLLHWLLFFESMNWRNVVLMRSVFGRWNMEVLPPLYFLPQVAWERLLPPLTNTLLACSVRSGIPHILW